MVGNQADLEALRPSAPYQRKKKEKQAAVTSVVRGIKPPQIADIEWVVDLPQAFVPKGLEALLSTMGIKNAIETLKRTWLPRELNSDSYGRHFKTLLHVEEAQMK